MNSERKNNKPAVDFRGRLINILMACALLFLFQSFVVKDVRAQGPVYTQTQQLLDQIESLDLSVIEAASNGPQKRGVIEPLDVLTMQDLESLKDGFDKEIGRASCRERV